MRCSVKFAGGELALVVLAVCRRGLMFWVGNAAVGILWRIMGMKQNRLSTWVKIQVEEMEQEFQPLLLLIWPLRMSQVVPGEIARFWAPMAVKNA